LVPLACFATSLGLPLMGIDVHSFVGGSDIQTTRQNRAG
jgi:hypothetical protein